MKRTIVLEMDDLNFSSVELRHLIQIREHIPQFKVTAFTIPMHQWLLQDTKRFEQYKLWTDMLKDNSDWLEIAIHGYFHDKAEMMTDYNGAKENIIAGERMFTKFKVQEPRRFFGKKWVTYRTEVPFVKVFKGAGWMMSTEAYEAARDLGYTVAVDRNQPKPQVKNLNMYQYNWSIEEPFPKDFAIVKGHGHMVGMQNDLTMNYQKLLRDLPTDAEYITVSEYIQRHGSD